MQHYGAQGIYTVYKLDTIGFISTWLFLFIYPKDKWIVAWSGQEPMLINTNPFLNPNVVQGFTVRVHPLLLRNIIRS